MDSLPMEVLGEIAAAGAYWGLATAYPRFARSLTAGRRVDWAIRFGHNVKIHVDHFEDDLYMSTIWLRNGCLHRIDGPAIESSDGDFMWCKNGTCHRIGGPSDYIGGERPEINWHIDGAEYDEHWYTLFTMEWN